MQGNIEFDAESGHLNGVPLLGGLFAGIVSFVAGYLSFLGIAAVTDDGIDFGVESLQQVGLLFYNSMQIPTRMQGMRPFETEAGEEGEFVDDFWYNPFFDSETIETENRVVLEGTVQESTTDSFETDTVGAFAEISLTLPTLVYVAIPVVLLFAIGALFAYRFVEAKEALTPGNLLLRSVVGGAVIVVGFLLVALAGLFAFVLEDQLLYLPGLGVDPQFTRPDRGATLLFAVLYPVVVGTAGVFVGQLLHRPKVVSASKRDGAAASDAPGATDDPAAAAPEEDDQDSTDDATDDGTVDTNGDGANDEAPDEQSSGDALVSDDGKS